MKLYYITLSDDFIAGNLTPKLEQESCHEVDISPNFNGPEANKMNLAWEIVPQQDKILEKCYLQWTKAWPDGIQKCRTPNALFER